MHDHARHLTDQDLLLEIDRELPARRQADVEGHLAQCEGCRLRHARLAATAALATEVCTSGIRESAGQGRQSLRAAMHAASADGREPSPDWGPVPIARRWLVAGATAAAAAMLVLGLRATSGSGPTEPGALPVAALTPGATWNVTVAELCGGGGLTHRRLPAAVRQQVLDDYGMRQVPADEYELDYLITPELGGAADARNIWPQRYGSRTWNAHVKDQLEELLPRLVCAGRVELVTAQRDIAANWIGAYKKYFDTDVPLPRARAARDDDDITYPVWRTSGAPALQVISFAR